MQLLSHSRIPHFITDFFTWLLRMSLSHLMCFVHVLLCMCYKNRSAMTVFWYKGFSKHKNTKSIRMSKPQRLGMRMAVFKQDGVCNTNYISSVYILYSNYLKRNYCLRTDLLWFLVCFGWHHIRHLCVGCHRIGCKLKITLHYQHV